VSNEALGYGVIGCGNIGPSHAEAASQVEGLNLVQTCDLVESKAKDLAEKYGSTYTTNMDELIARDDIQVVSICTPSGMHATHAVAAMQAGKHVLCEKPLDITLSAIDKMIATADECNVKLAGVFQNRTEVDTIKTREAIRNGKLGKLVLGDAYQKMYRGHGYYASAGWRATWEWDGGGCLMNQGVHGVDLIQWLVGKVKRVNAHARRLTRNIEVEDSVVAMLEYENGALGVLEATTSIPNLGARYEISGEKGSIVLHGCSIAAWQIEGEDDEVEGSESQGGDTGSDPLAVTAFGHVAHLQDLRDAIWEGREPEISGREARHAVEIIKAVYLSSREGGATIELPLAYEDDGPGIYPSIAGPRLDW
jgi:predicted dehydrogenase